MKTAKEILNEGKDFPQNIIDKIAKMTDQNDHTGARLLLAKSIKNKKMEKAYAGIEDIQTYLGHLPEGLYHTRQELDKEMFALVKKNYSNGNEVYMAF